MFSGFIQKARSEPLSTSVTISGTVVPRTCAFDESVQNITLHDVLRSDFSTGFAGATSFTIKVESCSPLVSSLNIRFKGTKGEVNNTFLNTGTSEGYSLALSTKESGQSVYDGVALVMPVQQGSGSIDMVAKYGVYSKNPVTGSFKSTVNISLEYN